VPSDFDPEQFDIAYHRVQIAFETLLAVLDKSKQHLEASGSAVGQDRINAIKQYLEFHQEWQEVYKFFSDANQRVSDLLLRSRQPSKLKQEATSPPQIEEREPRFEPDRCV
jgi:hypothetical protein